MNGLLVYSSFLPPLLLRNLMSPFNLFMINKPLVLTRRDAFRYTSKKSWFQSAYFRVATTGSTRANQEQEEWLSAGLVVGVSSRAFS